MQRVVARKRPSHKGMPRAAARQELRRAGAVRAGYTAGMIDLARYPQLRLIAWQRAQAKRLGGREALALYEANWRFVDPQRLTPAEMRLIRRLTKRYGHGVLNV